MSCQMLYAERTTVGTTDGSWANAIETSFDECEVKGCLPVGQQIETILLIESGGCSNGSDLIVAIRNYFQFFSGKDNVWPATLDVKIRHSSQLQGNKTLCLLRPSSCFLGTQLPGLHQSTHYAIWGLEGKAWRLWIWEVASALLVAGSSWCFNYRSEKMISCSCWDFDSTLTVRGFVWWCCSHEAFDAAPPRREMENTSSHFWTSMSISQQRATFEAFRASTKSLCRAAWSFLRCWRHRRCRGWCRAACGCRAVCGWRGCRCRARGPGPWA